MSDFGVYDDEMLNNRFSDQDVERLLSGGMPEDEDLAGLAPILEALHGGARRPLPEERIARFAAQAAEIATSTRPEPAGSAAPERTATRSRRFVLALRQKLATGLAAALLLSGLTGVAVASNGAAPGDLLYNLDRALEAFDIGDGKAAERIDEAQALFASGRVADAIAHAAEATQSVETEIEAVAVENIEVAQLDGEEPTSASEALILAANNVRNHENSEDESELVRGQVGEMLEAMAAMLATENGEFDPETFGQTVAGMAQLIGSNAVENAESDVAGEAVDEANSDAADNADNESADNAEQGEDAGPPDSVPPEGTPDRP